MNDLVRDGVVSLRQSLVALNVAAEELHPALRHAAPEDHPIVGIDRGLTTFAVVAGEDAQDNRGDGR